MRKCNLPHEIILPTGEVLKPVIGGHLENEPFLTIEHSHVDVTKNGWGNDLLNLDPCSFRRVRELIIAEAKRRKLKYRRVEVLSRNLRGKLDLYYRPYTATKWVFVEVKP